MRRDVYIENDSGGFSVLAADAVDAIIEDAREDDFRFVKDRKAMLIELYGDDSMPVRIVVDEPLTPDEEAQWLARYTWQIDTSDGRMLVMGGSILTSSPGGRTTTAPPETDGESAPWRRRRVSGASTSTRTSAR
jgi:hypothetical protein